MSGRTDRCFDFLGAEFASAYNCYDAGGKTLGRDEEFILISVDEDGLAQIKKSSQWPKGSPVFIDYSFLTGSMPTGRSLDDNGNAIIDGASVADALPPLDEFWK